jgi:hypothetical protein
MTEKEVKTYIKTYILDAIDSIYRDVKTMTSGNVSHRQACLLHDINAVRNNICLLIKQNTLLFGEASEKKDK